MGSSVPFRTWVDPGPRRCRGLAELLRHGISLLLLVLAPALALAAQNPVVIENLAAGTSHWRPGGTCAAGVTCKIPNNSADQIELAGYASLTSVNAGDPVVFYVTSNPSIPSNPTPGYSLEVYRLGYYSGAGGRSMLKLANLPGTRQPPCRRDPLPPSGTGLLECAWTPSVKLAVPADWTSGVYVARMENSEGYESYVPFVVRNDGRRADLLYQEPVTTYQAYSEFGGRSLYLCVAIGCAGKVSIPKKVSFDRPYGDAAGAGQLFAWDYSEQKLIFHLEKLGYDIIYTTDIDTHTNPQRLLTVKGFLSVGHDEYWTSAMYDAVASARDHGVNLAFLGANAVYWQTRLEPSSKGQPNRIMTCYRSAITDPTATPSQRTVKWRDLGRPEQTLIGAQFGNGTQYIPGKGLPFVVANASNWIFANTGLTNGAQIPDVVGQEWDTQYADTLLPPNLQYTIVSKTTVPDGVGYPYLPKTANAVIYQALSGSWVFGAGTIIWGHAMASSPEILQITRNVLDRFVSWQPARVHIPAINSIVTSPLLDDP